MSSTDRRWWLVALVLWVAGCEVTVKPPPDPPVVDQCEGLPAITVALIPRTVRTNGAGTLTARGGTGRYTYSIKTNVSGGSLSGDRYVAGPSTGTDVLQAADECGNGASVPVQVTASFSVAPVHARVRPGTTFTLAVSGVIGRTIFSSQSGALASGGSISGQGFYTAGGKTGVDLIVVQDDTTGEQVLVTYEVTPAASFRALPSKLALPGGSFVPLGAVDGSGVIDWRIVSGPGALDTVADGVVFRAAPDAQGTAQLSGTDRFTQETTTASVRILTELTRPGNRPQGRRTDVATLVTGDFDGDGILDLALGVPESDLARPLGGAVFIYKGTSSGLPSAPTWTITGSSDTAQLGAVMAAGDLDGDGKADLAISAPGDDLTAADSGAVYLYTIGANGPVLLRAALTGLGRGNFGAALAIADVDADGDNDLIVGSPGADLAPGAGFTARGVIDVFLLKHGQSIPDLGTIRVSGVDLAADGSWRRFSNLRAGRSLVVADLNGDSKLDLAMLTSVNNTVLGGTATARNVTAVQVHFGRATSQLFNETPDLFVLPANTADGDEGTWRLGLVPGAAGRPALLVAAADRADSPNLSADGGTAGGQNAGGALLYDLSASVATGAAPTNPAQLGRADAFARLYGDQAGISAGRSFLVSDLDGDGALELVLGAPYTTVSTPVDGGAAVNAPSAGKLLIYKLGGLSKGATVNRPDLVRNGAARADTLGTAVTSWNGRIAAFNSRATTTLGDFTGRLDLFSAGGAPASWVASPSPTPAAVGGQGFGSTIAVGPLENQLQALVGVPNISGPASDSSGNELNAGQAVLYPAAQPAAPRVLAEGASTPYLRDGGWYAFGGRPVANDVAMTDFDGDGRLDAVVVAPAFSAPTRLTDGGSSSTEYAKTRDLCIGQTSSGAALVHLGRADGTFKEAFRFWALRTISACDLPDGGAAATYCTRANLGQSGATGGFDFNGDGKQDLALTRTNGLEVLTGQVPDDLALAKPSMACDSLYSLPAQGDVPETCLIPVDGGPPIAAELTDGGSGSCQITGRGCSGAGQCLRMWNTSAPSGLGDLDGDGCDEVAVRYSDGANRQGVVIAFGFDATGAKCAGHSTGAYLRISGDTETGLPTMRLGVATARAGKVMSDGKDYVAITADLYNYLGQTQPVVLLVDVAQLVAKRPVSGGARVSILDDGLTPVPVLVPGLPPGFGRSLAGNLDVTGDGKPDLIVSSTGANINGDGTGAVFVFAGGTVTAGINTPTMLIVGDPSERASFGQDLSLSKPKGTAPAALGIGAPLSYRSGTANGAAFVLPLDF